MNSKKLCFLLVAILCASQSSTAQSDPCLTRTVPVNVWSEKRGMLVGLAPTNFKASIDHKPVRILSVTPNQIPARLMIVLDASGSMRDSFPRYLRLASELVQSMPPKNPAGLVVFADKVEETIPLTTDRQKLKEALTRFQGREAAKGHTALWDTLLTVASSQFDAPRDGDAIYAITDGQDNLSKTTVNDLGRVLLQKRVRLFLFSYLDPKELPIKIQMALLIDIRQLVVKTGGEGVGFEVAFGEISPEKSQPLRVQFQKIFAFDLLKVELPERLEKDRDWSLKPAGQIQGDLLTYPHRFAACSNVTAP